MPLSQVETTIGFVVPSKPLAIDFFAAINGAVIADNFKNFLLLIIYFFVTVFINSVQLHWRRPQDPAGTLQQYFFIQLLFKRLLLVIEQQRRATNNTFLIVFFFKMPPLRGYVKTFNFLPPKCRSYGAEKSSA
jgi:hypothetical protein